MKHSNILAACGLTLTVITGILFAGPLAPPGGPLTPTYKTLIEVEPRTAINAANTPGDASSVFIISQSGSYYLTANVNVPAGKSGIRIRAASVTVDLKGFTILGTPGSMSGIDTGSSGFDTVAVRGGAISRCGQNGVDLGNCTQGLIEALQVGYCGGYGIRTPDGGSVRNCSCFHNGSSGFIVKFSAAKGCDALNNAGDGLHITGNATLSRCRAEQNSLSGFSAAYANSALIDHCVSRGNTLDGFTLGDNSQIESCTAEANSRVGISANNQCVVRLCNTDLNHLQGIVVNDYCSVKGNASRSNGAGSSYAGIYLQGSGNRAEDNECTQNGWGLYIGGTDNFAGRNTCRANSVGNFSVPVGNESAPIITNPGTNAFATMTPWSNVAY